VTDPSPLSGAVPRLRALVEKWRETAEKDRVTARSDIEDGIWSYQHEAYGRFQARLKDADELSALLEGITREETHDDLTRIEEPEKAIAAQLPQGTKEKA
jgi:hypothetical protein